MEISFIFISNMPHNGFIYEAKMDMQGPYNWILTDFSKILTPFWPLLGGISPFFLTSLEGISYHESQIAASNA